MTFHVRKTTSNWESTLWVQNGNDPISEIIHPSSEADEDYESGLENFLSDFSDELTSESEDDIDMSTTSYDEIIQEFPLDLSPSDQEENLLGGKLPSPEQFIDSPYIFEVIDITGDDKVISATSELSFFSRAKFLQIVGVNISLKDTSVSRFLFNYVEDYYIIPPLRGLGFDESRPNSGSTPILLEIPKMKALSRVRKVGRDEMDSAKKLEYLFKTVNWVSDSSHSFVSANLMMIFGLVIFDYKEIYKSPFLAVGDGGLGGFPPFQNITTVELFCRSYKKGAITEALIRIMEESTRIYRGETLLDEAFHTRLSHVAQVSPEAFERQAKLLIELRQAGLSDIEVRDSIRRIMQIELPEEITSKGHEFQGMTTGDMVAFNHLRAQGIILNDSDIISKVENLEKSQIVLDSSINIERWISEKEFQKKNYKKSSLKMLYELYGSERALTGNGEWNHSTDQPRLEKVIWEYYRVRYSQLEQINFLSGGCQRYYLPNEIANILCPISMKTLVESWRQDYKETFLMPELGYGFYERDPGNLDIQSDIKKVLEGEFNQGIAMLPGYGTDDSRLAAIVKNMGSKFENSICFILVSNDKELSHLLHRMRRKKDHVYRTSVESFYSELRRNGLTTLGSTIQFVDPMDGIRKFIPKSVEIKARRSVSWRDTKTVRFKVLLDLAQIRWMNKHKLSQTGFFKILYSIPEETFVQEKG